jgi:hypothetical protein
MATRTQINNYLQNNRSRLESIQDDYRFLTKKYKQYKRGELHEALEIHEYVRPDGDVGYIAYLTADESGTKYVRTFHIGSEAIPSSTAWQLVDEEAV